jgi:hypothetical protein
MQAMAYQAMALPLRNLVVAANEQFRDLLFPGGPAGAGQGWQHWAYLLFKAQHVCLTHFRATGCGGAQGLQCGQCVFAPGNPSTPLSKVDPFGH